MRLQKKHRGISEVISTLLLLAISVVGASLFGIFINDFFEGVSPTQDSPNKVIQLLSYDARDSVNLMGITNLDNVLDGRLCGASCITNANQIPSNNGTEFFIVQLENKSTVSISLNKIYLNNELYRWDEQTSGNALLTTSDDVDGGSYPLDGKFSIMSTNEVTQLDKQVESGKTVNVLFKLGEATDISYPKSIVLRVNLDGLSSKEIIIQSGGAQ